MASTMLLPLVVLVMVGVSTADVVDIRKYGAVAGSMAAAANNTQAINVALSTEPRGTTILVPAENNFFILGGIQMVMRSDLTLQLEGNLSAVADFDAWPVSEGSYAHILHFVNCTNLTITGSGVINGGGVRWWNKWVFGSCGIFANKTNPCPHRPKAIVIETSSHVLVENITTLNSPSFNIDLDDVLDAEVRFVTVLTKRSVVRELKALMRTQRQELRGFPPKVLQPEDLNTDGIDPRGKDIWIHHVRIYNDDDSIAVKPTNQNGRWSNCTENILIENSIMSGFGASIGSVPPHLKHNCVRNITFRNISMPQTGKGVYIKSNPSCAPGKTGEITDILYENINISEAAWWPIWIGPQQQQEPDSTLGRKCSLTYPIDDRCPTQGCVTFTNITLRNILILEPLLSPGVILGNSTNPMHNITFDGVVAVMTKAGRGNFPYNHTYQTEHAFGQSIGGTTPDPGFSPM